MEIQNDIMVNFMYFCYETNTGCLTLPVFFLFHKLNTTIDIITRKLNCIFMHNVNKENNKALH